MPPTFLALRMFVFPKSGTVRLLALNELLRTFGHGAIASLLPVYLHLFGGLSASQVAYAAGVGGGIGIAGSFTSGRAIDRFGSKSVAVFSKIGQGLAIIAMCWTGGFVWVVSAFAVMVSLDTVAAASGGALVAHALTGAERVRARAYLRAVGNIGVSLGVGCGGMGLALHLQLIDRFVLVLAGLLSAGTASIIWRLKTTLVRTVGKGRPSSSIALRDSTYVTFVGSYLVLTLSQAVLTLGLPLFLVAHSVVPIWWYSPLLIANTIMVIVLQVRLSRSAEKPQGARRALVRSGYLYALAMVTLLGATARSLAFGLASLLIFVIVITVGEIYQSAGGWGLSYHLSPENSHGAYQALFAAVSPMSNMLGPLFIGVLLVPHPVMGSLLFSAAFIVAASLLQFSRGLTGRTLQSKEEMTT